MIEKNLKINVICDTCRTELQTSLEKKSEADDARFNFEMRVEPCPQCIVDDPEPEVISLTLHLNESERESIQIS